MRLLAYAAHFYNSLRVYNIWLFMYAFNDHRSASMRALPIFGLCNDATPHPSHVQLPSVAYLRLP